ncbi:CtsR family transcriptional regulator [Eubacteriales bacterium OttesenSCG-928-K08]|nr:CtsR family transcriptional regulator [Eubacteriales bacterium OttesenSCG-928-K08]
MSVLADSIALFINEMLELEDVVLLRRNELAQHFSCAPSQINYVLSTRFTLDQGYQVESRRGGGGYIQIVRVDTGSTLHEYACNRVGESITLRDAECIIARLCGEGFISEREAGVMQGAVRACMLPTQELTDASRAKVLKGMLAMLVYMEKED